MEEFNYRGYPIKKLVEMCDTALIDQGRAPVLFALPEQYSQGRIFREYARFPEELPLNIYADHGAMDFCFKIYPHEINNSAYAFFGFHKQKIMEFKTVSQQNCYKVPQPLIWYRREHDIKQVDNPQGTIFYAMHSTPDMLAVYDVKEICDMLKALPEEMQPVSVCLFMTDIHRGEHLKYMENGVPVYTAGNVWDIRFVDRFYEILRHFKYSASNSLGSYVIYSLEMGIPFSLIRQQTKLINLTDENLPKGIISEGARQEKIENLFLGLQNSITKQQRGFLDFQIDMQDYISSEEMNKVLITAYNFLIKGIKIAK